MKPLNLDNRPCSPISSNCVVWQGPTLDCIDLCTGDTISDVIAKMAEELCTLLDQTNVDNFDLTCLGITACGPKDFQALIQLLIDKICELEGIPKSDTKSTGGCPDCLVTVASCFIQNGQTTMQLIDYVNMIAEKVCGLISSINDLQNQINDLTIRVEVLENTPPPVFEVPKVTFSCAIGSLNAGTPYPIDTALQTYINSVWCPMSTALGTPTSLTASYAIPCTFNTDITSNPNWTATPTNLAQTITNIWIALCGLQAAIDGISLTVQDTNSIDLTFTSGTLSANIVDTGWEPLEGFDHMPLANRPQCRRIGNQVHFRGGVVIPLANGTGGLITYSASDAYNSQFFNSVFTGGGGCTTNTNGSITFNNDTSVVPSSIVDNTTDFDNTYSLGFIIASRQINLNSATYGTALSAVFNVGITSDKKLYVAVLKDLELTNSRGNPSTNAPQVGSSHLRYITSNVVAGEKVPVYTNAGSNIHSSAAAGGTTTIEVDFNAALGTYPFSCDAGNEDQIGGFAFRLDGLIAYLDPCTTDKKSYVACK